MITSEQDQRLHRLAYRMLGSVSDAEDVVQEAKLKLIEREVEYDNEGAYLHRIVSNLCIDRLRRLKLERKTYVGPWLPDPVPSEEVDAVELAESLSMAFMLLLERLPPSERAVYVLREGFDYSYPEIAQVLDVTPATVRQRASRARKKLGDPPPRASIENQKHMLEQLIDATGRGDVEALVELLAPDAVAYTDGGGVASAAIVPIESATRIAQVTLHLAAKAQADGAPLDYKIQPLNGGVGLVIRQGSSIHSTIQVDIGEHGLIQNVYVTRNPHKLEHLV